MESSQPLDLTFHFYLKMMNNKHLMTSQVVEGLRATKRTVSPWVQVAVSPSEVLVSLVHPRNLVSFDPQHRTHSPLVGKRFWVRRYIVQQQALVEGTSYPACLESPVCLFLLSEKWTHKAIGYFIFTYLHSFLCFIKERKPLAQKVQSRMSNSFCLLNNCNFSLLF